MTGRHDWIDEVEDAADDARGREPGHWTIDKRIPLALIVTLGTFLVGQSGAFIWWMSATSKRLEDVEKITAILATKQEKTDAAIAAGAAPSAQMAIRLDNAETTIREVQKLPAQMAVMQTEIGYVKGGIERIEQRLSPSQGIPVFSTAPPRPRPTQALTSPVPLNPPVVRP